MGNRIFLSYRRKEAGQDVRAVALYLTGRFSRKQLVTGGDLLEQGFGAQGTLDRSLEPCCVFLVLLDSDWLAIRSAGSTRGAPDDVEPMRHEIARALAKGIEIIPILVGDTVQPKAEELPDDIRELAHRRALRVRLESFSHDMEALEQVIRNRPSLHKPWARLSDDFESQRPQGEIAMRVAPIGKDPAGSPGLPSGWTELATSWPARLRRNRWWRSQ